MRLAILLFFAASSLHFEVTDARGKKPQGVTVEAGPADSDGWSQLTVTARKGDFILIWPYDGRARLPDGPEGVPVIVIQKGDERSAKNPKVVAALVAGALLGVTHDVGFDIHTARIEGSDDAFVRGVEAFRKGKMADAVDYLERALKERERRLTRVPSEIYPAAMLYGKALFGTAKYDDAAMVFLKAVKLRPDDRAARMARNEALTKAGKPEAVEEVP
jgi:hypothetical protein